MHFDRSLNRVRANTPQCETVSELVVHLVRFLKRCVDFPGNVLTFRVVRAQLELLLGHPIEVAARVICSRNASFVIKVTLRTASSTVDSGAWTVKITCFDTRLTDGGLSYSLTELSLIGTCLIGLMAARLRC